MEKLFRTAMVLVVILSLIVMSVPALAASKDLSDEIDPVTLMVYTPDGADSAAVKTLKEYAALIKDASDGLITLDVHHSGELGDANAAIASVQSGSVDIALVDNGALTPIYEISRMLSLPFLFDSAEQACAVANGEVGEQIFSFLPNIGLTFLAECDGSMRQVVANRPIASARDAQGLLISIPDYFLLWDMWGTLTAAPSVVAPADVPGAVAAEALQAVDCTVGELLANEYYDTFSDLSLLNYMWTGSTMLMNAATWNALPLEAQDILKEQALAAVEVSMEATAEENAAALEEVESEGMEIAQEIDIKPFQRALGGDAYYDRYVESGWCPADLLASMLAARK